jgi:deoxyribose-phosphate aldolase
MDKKNVELASVIEHTLLRADATQEDVLRICQEAIRFGFKAVCLHLSHVAYATEILEGKKTFVVAVVGFPLGASQSSIKAFEAKEAVNSGAKEIDMVMNQGALKAKDYGYVFQDIREVVEAVRPVAVKVILENCNLTDEEKMIACALAKAAGAAFVKTSTGFGQGGACIADVALMRKVIGKNMGIKASGGIRKKSDALKFIEAGADRIGASASVAMMEEV